MNQVRSCWGVLLNKAQEEVGRIQAELQQLRPQGIARDGGVHPQRNPDGQ